MRVVPQGHTLVLRLLLYLDVDVTAIDLFGCLPLHRAAEGGHFQTFRWVYLPMRAPRMFSPLLSFCLLCLGTKP